MLLRLLSLILTVLILQIYAIQCPPGFDLIPPNQQFGRCVVAGCKNPVQNQPCMSQCIQGFAKTPNLSCQAIKCVSSSKTLCTECEKGYQLQSLTLNQALRVCVPTYCLKVDKLTRSCQNCQLGYILLQNGICGLANCIQPNNDLSQCLKCKQGFAITKIPGGFNACITKNCINYSITTYECSQCQNSFVLNSMTGICKPGIKNCANFSPLTGLCYQCQSGYKIVALRFCIKEDPNCLQYDIEGCSQCKPSLKAVNGKCFVNYCDQINSTNPLICQKCQPGFILNSQKRCQHQYCQVFNPNIWACNQCLEPFQLITTTSISNPIILVQRCVTKFCQIFDNKRFNCTKCDFQHTLSNGLCVLSNCLKSERLTCLQCLQGWTFNKNGHCVIYDCLQFIEQTKCKSCEPGKRLYKNTCIKDNCIFRLNNGNCAQCPINYQIHSKFQQYCVSKFCKIIQQNSGDCLQCLPNYTLNESGLCISTTCTQYQRKQNFVELQCIKCIDGYQPKGTACIASTKYCQQYKLQQGRCINCSKGYELMNNKILCIPIKCKFSQPKQTYAVCRQCSLGYQVTNFDNGTQQCNPMNCTKIVDGNCVQCVEGFSLLIDICVAINCRQYNDQGLCDQCQIGFYLDPTKLICLREKCLQSTAKGCIKCQLGYYPDNTTTETQGLCRPQNCQKVAYIDRRFITDKKNPNTIICQKCVNGFTSLPNIQMCVSIDCLSQDITGLCRACRTGFILRNGECSIVRNNDYCPDGRYPGANSICQPIKAKNCLVANPQNTFQCYKCKQDYYLLQSDKSCRNYSNCIQKNYYLGCIRCQPGYKINDNTRQCEGTIPNCLSYNPLSGECQICSSGYQIIMNPNKICKLIPNFCLRLDYFGQCAQCKQINAVLNSDKQCIYPINDCQNYNVRGLCSNCSIGFYLVNQLTNPSCIPNPKNCDFALKTGQCIKCKDNSILQLGSCYTKIQRCVSYAAGFCIRCQPGYFVDTTSSCRQLPRNCEQVVLNTDGICGKCRPDFTNSKGTCVRSIDFCFSYDNQTGKCNECNSGYYLSSNKLLCLLGSI